MTCIIKVLVQQPIGYNCLSELYELGKKEGIYKTQQDCANSVGVKGSILTAILSAKKVREKFEVLNVELSTQSAYSLSTLNDDDQKRVVNQLVNKVIPKNLTNYIPKFNLLKSKL